MLPLKLLPRPEAAVAKGKKKRSTVQGVLFFEEVSLLLGTAVSFRHSEKGEMLLRGVGALRCFFPPNASVQWQPDGLTIHTRKWFLGAGFLGAPPISLRYGGEFSKYSWANLVATMPPLQGLPRCLKSAENPLRSRYISLSLYLSIYLSIYLSLSIYIYIHIHMYIMHKYYCGLCYYLIYEYTVLHYIRFISGKIDACGCSAAGFQGEGPAVTVRGKTAKAYYCYYYYY